MPKSPELPKIYRAGTEARRKALKGGRNRVGDIAVIADIAFHY
jgi:hypothetical protein